MYKFIPSIFLVLVMSSQSFAQDQSKSLEAKFKSLNTKAIKTQFETTKEWNDKIEKIEQNEPVLFELKRVVDTKYDADTEQLKLQGFWTYRDFMGEDFDYESYAKDIYFDGEELTSYASSQRMLKAGLKIGIKVVDYVKPIGSYIGENSFGVKRKVTNLEEFRAVIFPIGFIEKPDIKVDKTFAKNNQQATILIKGHLKQVKDSFCIYRNKEATISSPTAGKLTSCGYPAVIDELSILDKKSGKKIIVFPLQSNDHNRTN